MKTALKILLAPLVVIGLTALGMTATWLAERNPSPAAVIGGALESPQSPVPFDGRPLQI